MISLSKFKLFKKKKKFIFTTKKNIVIKLIKINLFFIKKKNNLKI